MGQQEIIKFLDKQRKKDKWWKAKEIAKMLNASLGTTTMSLKKLRKSNFVSFRLRQDKIWWGYEYQSKDLDI